MFSFLLLTCGFIRPADSSEKLRVTASIYPLAHFTEQVAGEFADVITIMPPGAEAHSFEPTPRDIKEVLESHVLFLNGAGIDIWAKKLSPDLIYRGIDVVEIAHQLLPILQRGQRELDATAEPDTHDRSEEIRDRSDYSHFLNRDPHFWLDPALAQNAVEIIRDALSKADPHHRIDYKTNSEKYILKLKALDEKYAERLHSCKIRDIIVMHNAYNYLARRYGIRVHPIAGLSPEEEPSAKRMAKLTLLAREKKIKIIFFEELSSPKPAQTIAHEIGGQTLALNSLEGLTADHLIEGKTYISVMEDNLRNLQIAMECTDGK